MKWYWLLIISVVVIAIISFVIYKTKTKKSTLVEGSECVISSSTRTAFNNTLPVVPIVGVQGVVVNGVCVSK